MLVLQDFFRPVTVAGYDPELPTHTYRTISGVLAYTYPTTGEIYHLVVHQAIHIPHLDHHLLCPFQCREHGIEIDERPKFQVSNPTDTTHAIVANDERKRRVVMPLSLVGITSVLYCHKPTMAEFESGDYSSIEMTSQDIVWEPSDARYSEYENQCSESGFVRSHNASARGPILQLNAMSSTFAGDTADIMSSDNFGVVLESYVVVSSVESAKLVGKAKPGVDHLTLAKRWCIPPDRAKQTVHATTQRGVRVLQGHSLQTRYPTNDRMMRYDRLRQPMFTDMLIAGSPSYWRHNKYAQMYSTNFGWARAHPMRKKSEARLTSSAVACRRR